MSQISLCNPNAELRFPDVFAVSGMISALGRVVPAHADKWKLLPLGGSSPSLSFAPGLCPGPPTLWLCSEVNRTLNCSGSWQTLPCPYWIIWGIWGPFYVASSLRGRYSGVNIFQSYFKLLWPPSSPVVLWTVLHPRITDRSRLRPISLLFSFLCTLSRFFCPLSPEGHTYWRAGGPRPGTSGSLPGCPLCLPCLPPYADASLLWVVMALVVQPPCSLAMLIAFVCECKMGL